ncbi:hypothetical protein HK104_000783 [Borealophlyctis nickersoniae]|nr:hypothetical protein HK104_000783 [Borealophlyctis nickersoniae]
MTADHTPPYVAAIDQGTSSSRFMVFDKNGKIVVSHQVEFDQILPSPGWVEHDPKVILQSVNECIEAVAGKLGTVGLKVSDIKGIGITNQRETTVVWDRVTGEPLHNAIVWLDTRTTTTVHTLVDRTPTKSRTHFLSKCGLPFSTYFSGVKLRWLLDNVPAVKDAENEGRLMFGTVDSWLLYNLTGGAGKGIHATDPTNASRTMLMNLETLDWDDELCTFFGVTKKILPRILSSAELYGTIHDGPLKGLPLSGCLGDQQAAMVGQRCFKPGSVKNTYGTGCFMLFNTGTSPVISTHGLLTTVAFKLGKDEKAMYALEGSIAIAGAAVKWLRDNLGLIKESPEVGDLAAAVKDTGNVYFVPAFSGLYAPHWREDARGVITGLTQYTTKHHIARATLEAVCFQSREVLEAMNSDSKTDIHIMRVDGGMTNSDLTMQLQADILGIDVERPLMRETTALGAAYAAGLGVGGIWNSLDDMGNPDGDEKFSSKIGEDEREYRFGKWKQAVQKSFGSTD